MSKKYPKSKIAVAIHRMVIDDGDLKSRLLGAFYNIMTLKEDDFPLELKDDWNFIHNTLTTYNGLESLVEDNLNRMELETCISIAERLYTLNEKLNEKQ